jgi:hypothetical protein
MIKFIISRLAITLMLLLMLGCKNGDAKSLVFLKQINVTPKNSTLLAGEKLYFRYIPEKNINLQSLENSMLVSYAHGPWQTVKSWQKPLISSYILKYPGLYSIQFNIRAKKCGSLQKIWLGQFNVAENRYKYIRDVSWRPYKVYFHIGESITLIILANYKYPLNQLTFQLSNIATKKPQILIPWSKYPIIKYKFTKPGAYTLRLDIKNSKTSQIESVWLGQFNVGTKSPHRDYLLRQVLVHHAADINQTQDSVLQSTAEELYITIKMLEWQYLHTSLHRKENALSKITFIKLKREYPNIIFTTDDGVRLLANLEKNTISDGLSILNIKLNRHQNIKKIFELTRNYPEKLRISAIITYLVASHYQYSQLDNRFKRPWLGIFSTKAHCLLFADILGIILQTYGYDVHAWSIVYGTDHNHLMSSHVINELKVKNKYYILDATGNTIGEPTKNSIKNSKQFGNLINLPYIRFIPKLYTIAPIQMVYPIQIVPTDKI